MRDLVQEILHGITGQKLILEAPEGRPTSVTSVSVFYLRDDDDVQPRPATTGAASVDTDPNTTLTAAAGAAQSDPTAIALASATNVQLRRPYLLTSAAGDTEWVELVALNGTAGVLRTPLLANYAIGATLQTTRMSIAIDPTWVADRSSLSSEVDVDAMYRVSWVYVVNGVTYRRQTQFDCVRYTAVHHVTPIDVDNRFPGWLERLPVDYRRDQGRALIDQAFREVKLDMRADAKAGRWLRQLDVVNELVACRANQVCMELAVLAGRATQDALTAAETIYDQRYGQLVREPHTSVGARPMGGQRDGMRAPLLRR